MTTNSQGTVDPLDFSAVFKRDEGSGPKASFYIPSDVAGTQADKSANILKSHIKLASEQFVESGMSKSDTEAIFAPIADLVADSSYWRLQSRGLAVFVAPDFHLAVRIPLEVSESVTVADHFQVLPLVPILENDGKCYILALAKNSLRLFDATRNNIEELPLGTIPESFDAVIGELPEQSLQSRAIGGGDSAFYGQGGSGETETMLTEKFIHAVGKAVGDELGTARSQPLVLASVAEYLPIFRDASSYPAVHGQVIAGNPEHKHPDELRSAAWKLLRESEAARDSAERERALSLVHNGKGALDVAEIARAADEGRVDSLYLPRDEKRLTSPTVRELVNRAVLSTVRTSGTLRTLGEWDRDDEVMATLRY
ncbi:hypothetical protein [Specibacter sp. NPDC078709]|uniref:baeRF3 domain-containing protein n=1 Tax=Specibacter sp. NPDC078709 TaxID=3154364 RepID=UPI00343ECBD0